MRHLDRAFPPLGADFMRPRVFIALAMTVLIGPVLCNGPNDWFLYVVGLNLSCRAGIWSREKTDG